MSENTTILHVKVKPGSFKDEITVSAEGTITIKIKERPIDGAANSYLIQFLAKEFKLSRNSVTIEKGNSSPFKKISILLSKENVARILDKYRSNL